MKFAINNSAFELADRDIQNPTAPERAYLTSLDASNYFASTKAAIMGDCFLSSAGKSAKLDPLADSMWSGIFKSLDVIQNEKLFLDNREKLLFAVAQISTPYEVACDREIRDWFRSLDRASRSQVLSTIHDGIAQANVVGALMRSPIPVALDEELRLVTEAHQQIRREENADEWALIVSGRDSVQWAERGMGHVVGISLGLTESSLEKTLRLALASDHRLAAVAMSSENVVRELERRIKSEPRMMKIAA